MNVVPKLLKGALGAAAATGLVVAGAAAPAAADSAATADAAAGEVYVALGDSMASGPLIPLPTGPLACGRSTENYAHELADRLDVAELRDVTCSGAKTDHMTQPQSLSLLDVDMGEAPPQFDALSADTTLVTLTIGGNDAGLVGVAQDCMQLNPLGALCKDGFTEGGADTVAQRIEAMGPKLGAVLDGIHARAPQARVLVTGYGDYIKPGGCWPYQPVLAPDADWLQGSVNHMNRVIADRAAAHGAEYVDVFTPSRGHDSCQSPDKKWVEGYVPTAPAAPLHPNARGEEAYAGIIHAQLTG